MSKIFLGDSVYIEFFRCSGSIYIDNGSGKQNLIFLRGDVLDKLVTCIKSHKAVHTLEQELEKIKENKSNDK